MQSQMHVDLVLNAPTMALWRVKPKQVVIAHSDLDSQYTNSDCQNFLKSHNLTCSMSRRGNCHDNAVTESFFQSLKRERIKRKIYKDRKTAKKDTFNYIKMFYSPVCRHGFNNDISPVQFNKQCTMKIKSA